jgi:hypothetical protein
MTVSHPLVPQLRFTRSEFRRAIAGVSAEDAEKRVPPMNSISWTVGHLAWQEQRYFLFYTGGSYLLPEIQERYRYGAPASTPPLAEMWRAWEKITAAVDPWLDGLDVNKLQQKVTREGAPAGLFYGNLLQRVIYHYWFHAGENMAVRKILGHTGLGVFVGGIDGEAPYTPET